MHGFRNYIQCALLALIAVAVHIITVKTGTTYFLTQLTMSAYYSLVIVSLCLLMGYAGQISLGHAGFFAIGGYVSASLTARDLTPYKDKWFIELLDKAGCLVAREDLWGLQILNVHPIAAACLAIGVTVVIAYVIGGPVLKLKGHYLAMATLGFGIIVYRVALGTAFLGEADGVTEVPGFPLPWGLEVSGEMDARVENYYIAWVVLIVAMLLILNLLDSRVGRALRAIHGKETAAEAMGVDTSGYKLRTFVLSAAFTALAGVLLTHYNAGIGPSEASVMKSVRYVAIVAVGGMANIWGALIMGITLNFLSLRGYFGSLDDAVFGSILILIMLFAPEGILKVNAKGMIRRVFGRKEDGGGD